jgi:hypothetical protein
VSNVVGLRHIQNLCGFSTPTAMEQSFSFIMMTLYNTFQEWLHKKKESNNELKILLAYFVPAKGD